MGLCIDPDENPQGLTMEIRRASVIFIEADHIFGDVDSSVEISKEYLAKLFKLADDAVWREKLTKEK
jgi:hypothetical protein